MDLDEEDEMVRAIAMSLGEKGADKIRGGGKETTPASPVSKGDQLKEDWESLHKFQAVIDTFTVTALSSCLALLDMLPDQVYRICDLLVTISKRNGQVWRDKMLRSLVDEVSNRIYYAYQRAPLAREIFGHKWLFKGSVIRTRY